MAEVQKLGRDIPLLVNIERFDVVNSIDDSSDGSTVQRTWDILKARVSLVKGGQHVVYTLRCVYDGRDTWTLQKRFSDVAALADVLMKRLPALPELPSKSMVRQFAPEYIQARKDALNVFLKELCSRRDALNCVETQQFFALPLKIPRFRQPDGSDPTQTAEVQEATFGITSFDYDPVQGLLLLGAADCSWASRIDTKITNIKLPWEPAAPTLPSAQMSLWKQSARDMRFELQFSCRFTAAITCVAVSNAREKGLCLCGLSDGTVGCHQMRGETGITTMGSTLPLLKHTASVVALAVDDAEQWIISASADNAIMVYDTRRQMILCEVHTPSPTTAMYYCSVQKRLFSGLHNGKVVVWDTSILPIQQLAIIPDGPGSELSKITSIDYDALTHTLFSGSKDGFTLWAIKSLSGGSGAYGRNVGRMGLVRGAPTALAWAASSREILAGFSNGTVVVYDLDKGEPSYALQAHEDAVTAMFWLDAPRRLVTSSKDKKLRIWDFPSLRRAPLGLEDASAFADLSAPVVSRVPDAASVRRPPPPPPPSEPERFDPTNPLAGGSRRQSAPSGYGAPAPPVVSYAGAAPGRGSFVSSGGAAAIPGQSTAPQRPEPPRVSGSKPGAVVKGTDSDDDLAGWDA